MATGKETSTTAEEAAEKLADQELDATGGGPGIPLDRIINPNRYHFGCGLWVPNPGHEYDERHYCIHCRFFLDTGPALFRLRKNIVPLGLGRLGGGDLPFAEFSI